MNTTSKQIINMVHRVLGSVDTDPCTTREINDNLVHASRYYTKTSDGLSQHWEGAIYCYPPADKGVARWLTKYHNSPCAGPAIFLLPANTSAKWFQYMVQDKEADSICFYDGSINGRQNMLFALFNASAQQQTEFRRLFSIVGIVMEVGK